MVTRSARVKCVEFHMNMPWVLAGLFSGNINIYDYESQAIIKSFEVSMSPIRAVKFVERKQWIIAGSDDLQIRIFNYNTMEKIKSFEAHMDFIRSICVHPTLPCFLTSSDDVTIKMWDWDKNFSMTHHFDGHQHYVMQVCFNPKDPSIFASASLDKTIKFWGINTTVPHFTLKGHEDGVNCIDFIRSTDKAYLASGGDDLTVRLWDYQTKQCLFVFEGHTENISAVIFHPTLPLLISASEDETIKIWQYTSFKLESTLNLGMERIWSIHTFAESNLFAFGTNEGTVVNQLGRDFPVVDVNNGRVMMVKNMEIISANLKMVDVKDAKDGERVQIITKELGTIEIYPHSVKFNYNGQYFAVASETDYVQYTSRGFKNSGYGAASDFVWSSAEAYAMKQDEKTIKICKSSDDSQILKLSSVIDSIHGGKYLGVLTTDFLSFIDWNSSLVIRRIEIQPKKIYWNEDYSRIALVCDDYLFILKSNNQVIESYIQKGEELEDGCEEAFELLDRINIHVESGCWAGQCFFYTTKEGKICYLMGKKSIVAGRLPSRMMLLSYIPQHNRVYLIDKSLNIYSYCILKSILDYQQAIINQEFKEAEVLLEQIPKENIPKLAKFLEANEMKELAYKITTDYDQKFDLALSLGKLQDAFEIAKEKKNPNKYKQIGDIALAKGFYAIAEESYKACEDLYSLFFLYSNICNYDGIKWVQSLAKERGAANIEFLCAYLLKDAKECLAIIAKAERWPEATFFAKAYTPENVPEYLAKWKKYIEGSSKINQCKLLIRLHPC